MRGCASFTSSISFFAVRTGGSDAPTEPARLKYPSPSMGETEIIATSTVRKFL